jgi:flagellar hook assembly protein FlgD
LGKSGSWTWDGLDDSGRPLPIGHYILMAEWFNLDGKKEQFKQAIVLARKLN